MKTKKNSKKGGFLLVEMLVSILIFTIVMLLSITAVLSILDANRKNQSMKSVINNLNLVINGVAKNLAVSKWYYCGSAGPGYPADGDVLYIGDNANCPDYPSDAITFTFNKDTDSDGELDVIRYRLAITSQDASGKDVGRVERSIDGGDYIPVTSPEVSITDLKFYVFDTDPLVVASDGTTSTSESPPSQPRVVMIVRGYAGVKDNVRTQFNIQTAVSQRSLDASYQ